MGYFLKKCLSRYEVVPYNYFLNIECPLVITSHIWINFLKIIKQMLWITLSKIDRISKNIKQYLKGSVDPSVRLTWSMNVHQTHVVLKECVKTEQRKNQFVFVQLWENTLHQSLYFYILIYIKNPDIHIIYNFTSHIYIHTHEVHSLTCFLWYSFKPVWNYQKELTSCPFCKSYRMEIL